MKSIIYALALVIIGQSFAQAKTILISDMDDTIKISHVLDKSEVTKNMGKIGNHFAGMGGIYGLIKLENPDVDFYYVSNAPPALMRKNHTNFLALNKFPVADDSLRMRPNPLNGNFKFENITSIINEQNPTTVIMVGDNGEHDTEIYAKVAKKYANTSIRFLQYLHTVYYTKASEDPGKNLENGQTAFVTAWDLFLQLRQENILSAQHSEDLAVGFAKTLIQEPSDLKDGSLLFPSWLDCRDFKWTAPDLDSVNYKNEVSKKSALYMKEKTLERCSHRAIED